MIAGMGGGSNVLTVRRGLDPMRQHNKDASSKQCYSLSPLRAPGVWCRSWQWGWSGTDTCWRRRSRTRPTGWTTPSRMPSRFVYAKIFRFCLPSFLLGECVFVFSVVDPDPGSGALLIPRIREGKNPDVVSDIRKKHPRLYFREY